MTRDELQARLDAMEDKIEATNARFNQSRPQPPSELELQSFEASYGLKIPETYRWFLARYAGGPIMYCDFLNIDPTSIDYLGTYLEKNVLGLPKHFFPMVDDQAGGAHGLSLSVGADPEQVLYYHIADGLQVLTGKNFYEFIADCVNLQ